MPGKTLVNLPGRRKIALAVIADALALGAAVVLSYGLRHAGWENFGPLQWSLLAVAMILGPACLALSGLYREITRYVGPVFALRVVKGCALTSLLLIATAYMHVMVSEGQVMPRTMPIIFFLLATLEIGGLRLVARWVLLGRPRHSADRRVAIFGAGAAGVGLHAALVHARSHEVVSYFDDNPSMQGRRIRGIPVEAPSRLPAVIAEQGIRTVLLALPSASRQRRRQIVEQLASLGVSVLTVPTLAEIEDGSARVDHLRPVRIEELLGRTPVKPDTALLQGLIAGRNVMVTGAGGSIGSELCRRILEQDPSSLILLDASEHNLYQIEMELREQLARRRSAIRLDAVLASVCDAVAMEQVCRAHRVQTVYHAAAYKHVPIVERNECAGIETNVFGTLVAAQAAARCGVDAFVFVSTDKAVRPASVMGASKRLAEILLQALQAVPGSRMRCSMVRFGNVLGSSGSVIPLFREQIDRGGPVTVTHPDMVRYFMTIPEAADLVIQAGAMAVGGEVFLLDMGEPVRIDELARNMIRLTGRTVRNASNPGGDIDIVYTGVRPGEKLFEELLIDGKSRATDHPSISLATEPFIPWPALEPQLERLRSAVDQRDEGLARRVLMELVKAGSDTAAGSVSGARSADGST